MRVLALDADVIVFISAFWQTTCTAVRSAGEGFVIDSPVYPDELDALPRVLQQSRFPVSGLIVTHGDWDHLLGRHAFPGASLGCGSDTAATLSADPAQPQRALQAFDEEHYVEGRPPLALEDLQPLPVPGRLAVGSTGHEIELHPAAGHTGDGTAFHIPWLGVLACGDYLSPVEIPWISPGGSVEEYLGTLERFRPLISQAVTIVPGHGHPLEGSEAHRILDEDVAYLQALQREGADAPLPGSRITAAQRRIHGENVERLSPRAADTTTRRPN